MKTIFISAYIIYKIHRANKYRRRQNNFHAGVFCLKNHFRACLNVVYFFIPILFFFHLL